MRRKRNPNAIVLTAVRNLRSADAKRLANSFGFAVDDQKISPGWAIGDSATLLPVAQRVDVEAEAGGEELLSEAQLGANGLHVDLHRDVNFAKASIGSAFRVGESLFKASADAIGESG